MATCPFKIESWTAIHAGNTKFYRVYEIIDLDSGNGVVVFHWGATGGRTTIPTQLTVHGQVKIHDLISGRSCESLRMNQIKAKQARGYHNWKHSVDESKGLPAFINRLHLHFEEKKASAILMALHIGDSDKRVQPDEEEYTPYVKPEPKREPKKGPVDRGPEWGAW